MDFLFVAPILVVVYLVVNFIAYLVQERFIFKPEKLAQDFEYQYRFPFYELFFDVKTGVRINGLHFPANDDPAKRKGIVVYFHGNTRSIKGWGKYSRDFTDHGWDVLMIDYRGFGKSTGRRTEFDLKADAQFVYRQLLETWPEEKIVVYGRSIGSGFAAKLASQNYPALLILDAPYYSFTRLARRYLPFLPIPWILRYPLRTHTYLKYVRCPIRIIHGTKDRLIPYRSSVDLAQIQPLNTILYAVPGGHHNDLPSFPLYHEILAKVLREAETQPPRHPIADRTDIF